MLSTRRLLLITLASAPLALQPAWAECPRENVETFTAFPGDPFAKGIIETFTVPPGVTEITVEAFGASGGQNQGARGQGGRGARMRADFDVEPGEQLQVLVGRTPGSFNGGGGGSFVARAEGTPFDGDPSDLEDDTPLCIAGGGGGFAFGGDSPNKHGNTGPDGGEGLPGNPGGTNGDGGSNGTPQAGGGGGFDTDGEDSPPTAPAAGGHAYRNGGFGGIMGNVQGGFGGGAAGSGVVAGGGGGGYSGGGGSNNPEEAPGGGGGSLCDGANSDHSPGEEVDRLGDGLVEICWDTPVLEDAPGLPALGSLQLGALGLLMFGLLAWTIRQQSRA